MTDRCIPANTAHPDDVPHLRGQLILRLPPQALNPAQSRDFGPLQLVRAP